MSLQKNSAARFPGDFETIARRYAALPRNRRTLGNWVHELAQSVVAPTQPRLRWGPRRWRAALPVPVGAATRARVHDLTIWRREHAIADGVEPAAESRDSPRPTATRRASA